MTDTYRGTCPHCDRRMHVRFDGLLRKHRDLADQDCPGGNGPPLDEDVTPAVQPQTLAGRLRELAVMYDGTGLTARNAFNWAADLADAYDRERDE